MAVTTSSGEKHVAVLVFPFTSHPLFALNLLRRVASLAPKVHFSFLNTEKSTQSLLSKTRAEDIPHNIKFYEVADGVPEDHVLTGSLPEHADLFLKATPANFKRGIDKAVAETGKRVTCLLSDAFLTCAAQIAEELNVPWIAAWITHPCCLSAHVYTDLIRERFVSSGGDGSATLDFIPGFSAMRFVDLPEPVLMMGDEEEPLFLRTLREIGSALARATAVVLNFFEDLNPSGLSQDLRSKFQNVFYVGFVSLPLPAPPLPPSSSDVTGCLSWLDGQKSRSVAYFGFGTIASLPREELIEVAEALQESEVPFLWSLDDKLKELLPKGFLEKTSMQGKIVPWTPQTQVLAHPSIGVYVTHCGGNSVSESIVNGVPVIGRPFFADNHMIGRMLELWGVGVKVEGRVITKDWLLKSLELVLRHEKGKEMREKAEALRELILKAAGSATEDLNRLVNIINGA